MICRPSIMICFGLGLALCQISSAETIYTSKSAWQNASGALTSISFDAANWTYSVVPISCCTVDDIATSIAGPAISIDHSNYLNGHSSAPLFVAGSMSNGVISDHDQYIFRFATPIYAFGADFVFSNPDAIVAPAGQHPTVPMHTGFYGMTSVNAITEIDLVAFGCSVASCPGGDFTHFTMSNLSVQATSVPEPAYLPLFLVALVALSLLYLNGRRRLTHRSRAKS